jgi:cytochrome c oxidase assembly protein subunit 15
MFERLRERTNGFTVTPRQFSGFAIFSAVLLTLIIATGAGVRLSDSGLGCKTWPNCMPGELLVPADLHSFVEFGNRMLSALVSIGVLITAVASLRRRPYRRDLALLAWSLPLGAGVQAGLGAMSVKSELAWEWVVAHFAASMIMQIFVIALVWRSLHEPGERPAASDRTIVYSIRGLLVLTAAAWISGMGATAAGPHAGGHPGQAVSPRWEPKSGGSLEWVVHRHGRVADLLGIFAIAVFVLLWRRRASRELLFNAGLLIVLIGIQGLIGSVQWHEQLPAELVWLHVLFSALCWSSALWLTMVAGRLGPRGERASDPARYENAPLSAS